MLPRIRDVEDALGACLRLIVGPHASGVVVTLERRDLIDQPCVMLGLDGAEILSAFIMAARLSVPGPMPDEIVGAPFSAIFRLMTGADPRIVIEQDDSGGEVEIPSPMWDRLYAELCLVLAHARAYVQHRTAQYQSH